MARRQQLRERALLDELEPLMHQPIQAYANGGTYVTSGSKRIRLSNARAGTPTLAGTVYYEQILGVKFPEQYSYNQSLEHDRYIRGFNNERIQVRRRGADGTYKILPAGIEFFKYHKSFWLPLFPRRILKRNDTGYELVDARSGWYYVPLSAPRPW